MTIVDIYICVGQDPESYTHTGFHNHEISHKGNIVLIIAIINGQLIVSTHLKLTLRIGKLQPIMCIKGIGVYRLSKIVYGVSFGKAFAKITGKELGGGSPIGLTMLKFITVTDVIMGEVVERNINGCGAMKTDNRHRQPVVACHYLKRSYPIVKDFIALSTNVKHRYDQ